MCEHTFDLFGENPQMKCCIRCGYVEVTSDPQNTV